MPGAAAKPRTATPPTTGRGSPGGPLRPSTSILVGAAEGSICSGFDWVFLLGSVGCLLLAYFIWPSKKRGQHRQDHWILDLLEFFIELPVEILLWSFRLLARIFKSKDGGFDIDL